jgi:hypothetical protein
MRRKMMNEAEEIRGALLKGIDAGGLRWFLDGQPVPAGTSLELHVERDRRFCPSCRDEDDDTAKHCPTCGGRGVVSELDWLLVRLEFDCHRQVALAYLPTLGCRGMHSEVLEGARFRWPS